MLVLSRKVGEQIVIDDNITVVVNRIDGNRVSLGIQAPKHIKIVRGELTRFDGGANAPVGEPIVASFSPITFDSDATGFRPSMAR